MVYHLKNMGTPFQILLLILELLGFLLFMWAGINFAERKLLGHRPTNWFQHLGVLLVGAVIGTFLFGFISLAIWSFISSRAQQNSDVYIMGLQPIETESFRANIDFTKNQYIDGLSAIQVGASPYYEDEVAISQGVGILVNYLDKNGSPISFEGPNVEIIIRFYGFRTIEDFNDQDNAELVFEGEAVVNRSPTLGEFADKYIRVSHSQLAVDSSQYVPLGIVVVTLNTPLQGPFTATSPTILFPVSADTN